jgi:putative endonuclease
VIHYVYIIFSEKVNRFYVGISKNPEQRLNYHNNPFEARKYTAKGAPWVLKCTIPCENRTIATLLERRIKKAKSKLFIEQIISDPEFLKHFCKST